MIASAVKLEAEFPETPLWRPPGLDLRAYQEEFDRQHRRYRRAIQAGDRESIRRLENLLLKSHTAKILALAKAARKKKYPLCQAKLHMMASTLSCWEQPVTPATLYFKEKADGGLRPIFRYGVMWAAQQYLVLWMLAPRLRLHEGQYGVPGRDRTAAIEKAKQLIEKGYHWVIRGDITNCHPSMDGEKVLAGLPGPRAVLRQVILPPAEEYLVYPYRYHPHVLKARRGLPQGAASTPMVAAAALAPVLDGLPDGVVPILYVDDFAIFASSKAAAVETMNTIRGALRAASVGDLQLKFCSLHHVSEGFGFLGYHIIWDEDAGVIARPRQAAFEKLYQQLEAIDASAPPDPHKAKRGRLFGWRCSYAAWDGDEYGDDVLFAILGNHFSGDLDELIRSLHLRAQQTKEKSVPT